MRGHRFQMSPPTEHKDFTLWRYHDDPNELDSNWKWIFRRTASKLLFRKEECKRGCNLAVSSTRQDLLEVFNSLDWNYYIEKSSASGGLDTISKEDIVMVYELNQERTR